MVKFPYFLWKTWPLLLFFSLSLYIFSPLSRLSPSVFNGSRGCLNKESVKNLLYMTSARHNRRQLRLLAAKPREKMSTPPAKHQNVLQKQQLAKSGLCFDMPF